MIRYKFEQQLCKVRNTSNKKKVQNICGDVNSDVK